MTNKELVLSHVRELPDGITLNCIAEEVAILAAIREGERAIEKGQFISHAEVKRQVKQWITRKPRTSRK